ncbi:hypothetical protein A6770_01340 [Nostoc minutum NIES-26]|uniref:Uncharacterized protein n=1 Tax=Nostoc minutum NIES-26 TaxID=1844469 RepID=A0A367R0I7_9NOSO|nr:hypothetical protein A6770_01340 [Nostoc minutum NIES-26]
MLNDWGLRTRDWGVGKSFPILSIQYPIPSPQYLALIIGNKTGKLPTASIIEFDLLFNANTDNQL